MINILLVSHILLFVSIASWNKFVKQLFKIKDIRKYLKYCTRNCAMTTTYILFFSLSYAFHTSILLGATVLDEKVFVFFYDRMYVWRVCVCVCVCVCVRVCMCYSRQIRLGLGLNSIDINFIIYSNGSSCACYELLCNSL